MKETKPYFITETLETLISLLQGKAYFVGGVVRDFLMHRPIGDIDMATSFNPDEVQKLLENTDIRIIPTGIKHGTLTLLFKDGQKVEITSFRQDIQTDGRHALVRFGTDITQDADRRDLTINALYMDKDGHLLDPVGGLKDLKQKRIKFIGNAEQRIKEDALRILRFYRFYGLFTYAKPNKSAVMACRKQKRLLENISKERIKDELFKLLSQQNPYKALRLMNQTGVLFQIFERPIHLQSIRHLFKQERKTGVIASPLFRCWVLNGCNDLPLKLSNNEKKQINLWKKADKENLRTTHDFLKILFLYGKETFLNMILYKKKNLNFPCFFYMQNLKAPVCPFSEKDVMEYFNLQGKDISKRYQKAVKWWIDSDFPKKSVVFKAFSE